MSTPEVTIRLLKPGKVKVVAVDGAETEELHIGVDELTLRTVRVFNDLIRQGVLLGHRDHFEVVGANLYRLLFKGDVETLFLEAWKRARLARQQLRVQLVFEKDADELAELPWEYLFYPDDRYTQGGGVFFSTALNLVLIRYIPLKEPRVSLEPGERLRILFVVSEVTDKDLAKVEPDPVDAIIEWLESEKAASIDIKRVPGGDLPFATFGNVRTAVEEHRPHIVHFLGHGRFRDDEGALAFVKDPMDLGDGKVGPPEGALWFGDKQVRDLFMDADHFPKLMVLHLCEGAKVDFKRNFAGLAPKLIRAGIPAVIAMQHPITPMHGTKFSRAFYEALLKHQLVGVAVQAGRHNLVKDQPDAYRHRVFGTPVLYLHGRDAAMLPPPPSDAPRHVTNVAREEPAPAPVGAAPGPGPNSHARQAEAGRDRGAAERPAEPRRDAGRDEEVQPALMAQLAGQLSRQLRERATSGDQGAVVSLFQALAQAFQEGSGTEEGKR